MKRRHHLALALTAVSLVLTGCNGTHPETKVAVVEPVRPTTIVAMVAAVAKAKTSHVNIVGDFGGRKVSADGDIESGAAPKVDMNLDFGMGPVESRLIGNVIYANLGPLSGDKFFKIDLGDRKSLMVGKYDKMLGQFDPAKMIDQFKHAVSMTKKGKPVEKDGVEAQPYVIVVDSDKIPIPAHPGRQARIPRKIVVTVWVGPDDLPRSISTAVAGNTVTVDFSSWGDPVGITVPSKFEITDTSPLDRFGQLPKR